MVNRGFTEIGNADDAGDGAAVLRVLKLSPNIRWISMMYLPRRNCNFKRLLRSVWLECVNCIFCNEKVFSVCQNPEFTHDGTYMA